MSDLPVPFHDGEHDPAPFHHGEHDPAVAFAHDPAGPPGRTRLAWRRTCLAAVGLALAGLRLAPAVLGVVGLVVAAGLVAATASLWAAAARRCRWIEVAWDGDGLCPGGRLLLACSGVGALIGVGALCIVTDLALSGTQPF